MSDEETIQVPSFKLNWKKFILAAETQTAAEESLNRDRLVDLVKHLNKWDAKFLRDTLNEIHKFEK